MRLSDRRWLGFGLALLLGLALLGRWAMHSLNALHVPARVETLSSNDASHEETSAPATVDPSLQTVSAGSASAAGNFRGRVIDAATRAPVQEFTLEIRDTSDSRNPVREQTFSTSDGRFEVHDLPFDNCAVIAMARGYQRFELDGLVCHGSTEDVTLALRPGYTLQGRVFDEATNDGIASASIAFREAEVGRFEGEWRSRVRVASDEKGSFVLDGLPAGRITLEVDAQDHAAREVDVVAGADTAPLEIGLSIGGTIAGRLTAADGVTPIAGTAGLFDLDREFGGTNRTDDDGGFSFPNLAPGRYKLTGQAEGASVSREIALSGDERIEDIVLVLGAGHSIRGVVTGLRPELLRNVRISLRGASDFSEIGVDDRGAYDLRGVRPGRVVVVADVNMQRLLSKTVEMPEDSDITVNLDFPAGARLSGRVTYGGTAFPGLNVMPIPLMEQGLFLYATTTDADGEYVVEDLPAGEYSVRFGRFRSERVRMSADTVLDVDIPDTLLSGRVLLEGGELPIVGADVHLWTAAESSPSPLRLYDHSNDIGRFQLRGLEPGDFILTVYKPGYRMFRERISYNPPAADMTVELRPDSGVEVRVRDAGTGQPLQAAFAFERIGDRNGMQLELQLDDNGVGHVPGELGGSTLAFAAQGYAVTTVQEWNGQELDLRLTRETEQ